VSLRDDTPIVPGDVHAPFENIDAARQVLNDAEDELRAWSPSIEPIHSTAGNLGAGAMPGSHSIASGNGGYEQDLQDTHPAYREKAARSRSTSGERRITSGTSINSAGSTAGTEGPPYPISEVERREAAQV